MCRGDFQPGTRGEAMNTDEVSSNIRHGHYLFSSKQYQASKDKFLEENQKAREEFIKQQKEAGFGSPKFDNFDEKQFEKDLVQEERDMEAAAVRKDVLPKDTKVAEESEFGFCPPESSHFSYGRNSEQPSGKISEGDINEHIVDEEYGDQID